MKTLRKLNEFAKFFFGSILFLFDDRCAHGRTSFWLLRKKIYLYKIEMKSEFIQILFSIKRLKINEQFH